MSLACVLYLISSLDLIDPQIPTEETRLKIIQCLHDLQLYANDHWLDHLSALENSQIDSILDRSMMLCLSRGLERLTERHNELVKLQAWNTQDDGDSLPDYLPSTMEKCWPQLGFSRATQSLLNRVSVYRSNYMGADQVGNSSCMYTLVLFFIDALQY